jgi:hypothetical protein
MTSARKRSEPISQSAATLRELAGCQGSPVALAHKNAANLQAVMTKGEAFDAHHVNFKPDAPMPAAATPRTAPPPREAFKNPSRGKQ